MEICDTRKVFCKYPLLDKVVEEYSLFGWTLSEKILLNRFGSPVPNGVTFDEDDLREKCSYELSFFRCVESENVPALNALQEKYGAFQMKSTRFSKGRVTGLVWLSIAFSFFMILGAVENAILLILAALAAGGCVAIILAGAKNIQKAKKYNEEILAQKNEVVLQAKQLLETKNAE